MPADFSLNRVTAARPGGRIVLDDLTWAVADGETWAVVGPTAAGKSSLAELLVGRLRATAGHVHWPLLARVPGAVVPSDVCQLVSFREDSRLFRYAGHYYQQRFEFADADEPLSLFDYLSRGRAGDVSAVAAEFGLAARLRSPFITLSNGETRRARLARAVLANPEVLILDDPFMGLDAAGRAAFAEIIHARIRGGTRVILLSPTAELPDWVTHVLALRGGRVTSAGPRPEPAPPVIEFTNVTVSYRGVPTLIDVSWTVRRGERWAVTGPNGSGKTTLLSLVCGDHPQAYSAAVTLFGNRRGQGESVWELKAKLGLVSPELHLYFTAPLTAGEAVLSGFHDVTTYRPTSAAQELEARTLFAEFGVAPLFDRPFAQLSTGEQRLALFLRAVVKRPQLLVLDEPFQGLDADTVTRAKAWLDANLAADQTLLFVTHHDHEIPGSVTRRLRLDGGRAAVTA